MKFNYELPKVDARFSPDKVESKVKTFSEISEISKDSAKSSERGR